MNAEDNAANCWKKAITIIRFLVVSVLKTTTSRYNISSGSCLLRTKIKQGLPRFTLLAEPFLTVHMLCTEKRLCANAVKFLLSMLSALLSNIFEPRLNRCSFLTVSFRRHFYLLPAGSVSIIGFSQKLMLALEKPV